MFVGECKSEEANRQHCAKAKTLEDAIGMAAMFGAWLHRDVENLKAELADLRAAKNATPDIKPGDTVALKHIGGPRMIVSRLGTVRGVTLVFCIRWCEVKAAYVGEEFEPAVLEKVE